MFLLIVMPVSIKQWRIEIDIFNAEYKFRFSATTSLKANCTLCFCTLGMRFVFALLMLLVCVDIELNPGPKKRNTCFNLSICHRNLNSKAAHNFEKINLPEAYITQSTNLISFLYQRSTFIPLSYLIMII